MPRTRFHKGSTSNQDESVHTGDVFDGYEAPNTIDGSYMGRMKNVKAREDFLEEKFQEALSETKARLKKARTQIGLVVSGGTIQLQATLPLKPDDKDTNGTGSKQYRISLGIPASLEGLKTAEEEAYELGKLKARGIFTWTEKYLKLKRPDAISMNYILEHFEEEYFKTRKRNIKSEGTFGNYFIMYRRYCGKDIEANRDNFVEVVKNISSDSVANAIIVIIQVVDKLFGLQMGSFSSIRRKETKRIIREVPSDKAIVEGYAKYEEYVTNNRKFCYATERWEDNWLLWRWMYGMCAVFGLRPREIIIDPDIEHWLSEENIHNTWKVSERCKTGARDAIPLYVEWIKLFDLKNPVYLEALKQKMEKKTTAKQINAFRHGNDHWFRKVGVGFNPYDLRHAWAIRAHLLNVPVKVAAVCLGHSVEMHTRVYQKWISLDACVSAINQALTKKSEIDLLREENERLKTENEMLRKMLPMQNSGFALDER